MSIKDKWDVNTIEPTGVYDEAKRFQESITLTYPTFQGVSNKELLKEVHQDFSKYIN